MNPFDMIVVVVLVYFIIIGLLRGSIREVTSIIALLGGFYFAYLYYESFATVFSVFIDTDYVRNIAAFLVLFCIFAVTVTLLGALLRALLKLVLLGVVDRLLGGIIGAVKAVIVISILHFLALTFLPSGGADIAAQSKMAPAVKNTASVIVYLVPESFKQALSTKAQKLRWQWESQQEKPQPDESDLDEK